MAKKTIDNNKALIIVESPTKAKTIKKFLPANCTVIACNGHVRDLPSKEMAIDTDAAYTPKYEISAGKEKIIKTLKSELATSGTLMLATDEDREGESISWHLLEVLKPKIPYQRMVFHEITKNAILKALENGRELDMALVNAQEARRILDRLYGYTISPVLWKKLSMSGLSAGRVQSPGLRLIVERERQRMLFMKASYWDVKAQLKRPSDGSKAMFEARLDSVGGVRVALGKDFDANTGELLHKKKVLLLDEKAVTGLIAHLEGCQWTVTDIEEKQKNQRPAPPFITSTLQQEGNRKLHLSTKDTMKIAQKLYESGLITYMRTDSPMLSQEGIQAARNAARDLFGVEYLSPGSRQYASSSASAQEAHEAIRPAGEVFVHPDRTDLKGKDLALYELIWKRTLACQMAEAVKANTTVRIAVDDAQFTATGNRIVFPGFIRVYVEGKDDPEAALEDSESWLPVLEKGQPVERVGIEPVGHETKPPARFTEATLVQELEKLGIGRPSTYATIIEKLFERVYVVKDGTALIPTFTGFAVMQLLENNFSDLVDYSFTSTMENALDGIALGKIDELAFLKEFYEGEDGLKNKVERKTSEIKPAQAKLIKLPNFPPTYPIMVGKFGPYAVKNGSNGDKEISISLPDSLYPGNITLEDVERLLESKAKGTEGPQSIGTDPVSGVDIYLLTGKFGPYFQLGLKTPQNPSPKRASVPKGVDGAQMAMEDILRLLSLPRTLGTNPATGEPVIANKGKFGPYVGSAGEFRSLPKDDSVFSVTLEEALVLLAAPKPGRPGRASRSAPEPVMAFGEYEGNQLVVVNGKYGFYGKLGKLNIPLPMAMRKDAVALKTLTRDQLVELLKEREAKKK
ncbi:MAG: type I DNA topoisomerase [Sphaerochaetaceae bacterium]